MSGLKDLDDRLVPRLAQRLRDLVDGARERRRHGRDRVSGAWSALTAPGESTGFLRRLDDRYARSGPLALLRDVPQLGLLLAAAIFLTASGVALARSGPDPERLAQERAAQAAQDPTPDVLGPEIGEQVEPYLQAARQRAAELSRADPEREHLAIVHLRRSLKPLEAQALLVGIEVERAYLRAQVPGEVTELLQPDVQGDLVDTLRVAYADAARRKLEDQREFAQLARSITPASKEERQFKAFYEDASATAGKEAAAYRAGCACVFAVVVRASANVLAQLPALNGVRGVDVAASDRTLTDLVVTPLLPEDTGAVEALPRAGS